MEEDAVVAKLGQLTKLAEDMFILTAIKAGANKRALARFLGVQNIRVSQISKILPRTMDIKSGQKSGGSNGRELA